jgi:hypothetical protein
MSAYDPLQTFGKEGSMPPMNRILAHALLSCCLSLAAPVSADAQLVPEGIHQNANGPVELCGLKGTNVAALVLAARGSDELRSTPIDSDRFELFASKDSLKQLVFTRSTEAAYPAATCRHAFKVADGSWQQTRDMRCEATREACDKLFLEFQDLDQRLAASLGGRE